MLQYLIDHHDFQEFLKYKEHWVKTLENVLLDEVYIIGTVVKEMTEKDNLPAKMKIFMLKKENTEESDKMKLAEKEKCEANARLQEAEKKIKELSKQIHSR